MSRLIISAGFLFAIVAMPLQLSANGTSALISVEHENGQSFYHYRFPMPGIRVEDGLTSLSLAECTVSEPPGHPAVPTFHTLLAAPAGSGISHVAVTYSNSSDVELSAPLDWVRGAYPLSQPKAIEHVLRDEALYRSDTPLPAAPERAFNTGKKHRRTLIEIPLQPLLYTPAANLLTVRRQCTVTITWEEQYQTLALPSEAGPTRDRDAQDIALLTDAVAPTLSSPIRTLSEGTVSTGSILPVADYEHIVISPEALIHTGGVYSIDTIVRRRNSTGMTSTNVPLEWVLANYDGTRPSGGSDDPTRIRNFLRDAYERWGTRYLLLVGDEELMPSRKLYANVTFRTENMPADIYYACLDDTFDSNTNGIYGEYNDGPGGNRVDMYGEIYVGRWLVDDVKDLTNIVRKTLLYEDSSREHLQDIAFCGEYLGFGGIADYAKPIMEEIRTSSSQAGFTTTGFETSRYADDYDTLDQLYDKDFAPSRWSVSAAVALMNRAPQVINHMGHGAAHIFMRMYKGNIASVTNRLPTLIYSQACEVGAYDTVEECFAEALTTHTYGPFAVIMNVRFGWGFEYTTDGPSQRYNRTFWDGILARDVVHLGRANRLSKERLISFVRHDKSDPIRWSMYAITLFGDPATPFSARITDVPIAIEHTPLQNQYDTNTSYEVSCRFDPDSLLDTNAVILTWSVSGDSEIHTNMLEHISNNAYRSEIPAQPRGTTVSYRLHAANLSGSLSASPDLLSPPHMFDITPPIELSISGFPGTISEVSPTYGTCLMGSGVVVHATATIATEPVDGYRYRCSGWVGSGAALGSGDAPDASFTLDEPASLLWLWEYQAALYQSSSVEGILTTTSWWETVDSGETVQAPDPVTVDAITYRFGHWVIAGERVPLTGTASNQLTGIPMQQPQTAVAVYLPEAQDADNSGIADWWELRYAGATNIDTSLDVDGDGASFLLEYLDQTDPNDLTSVPAPPAISHTPIASPCREVAPYRIAANVTDSSALSSVLLTFSHNGGAPSNIAMTAESAQSYAAAIPPPSTQDDQFSYLISAVDSAGQASTNGPHEFLLVYPTLNLSPTNAWSMLLEPGMSTNCMIVVSNSGNSELSWALRPGWLDDMESGTNQWSHPQPGDTHPWILSTARSASGDNSWYAAMDMPVSTPSSVHARLDTPAFTLGPNARLRFNYWVHLEDDSDEPGFCFDGGIVEISTNDGLSFAQLDGPYTHLIQGWTHSPWPQDTPCFSGLSEEWRTVEFDMSEYAGTTAIVRFHAGGDNNTSREGWYVDDVAILPADIEGAPWITTTLSAATLAPGVSSQSTFLIDADAAGRGRHTGLLDLNSNDPEQPSHMLRVDLRVSSPPEVAPPESSQVPDGTGHVVISNLVVDADGDSCRLAVEYSTDQGVNWAPATLASATTTGGLPLTITPPNSATVETGAISNHLLLTWNTLLDEGNALHPVVHVRAKAYGEEERSGYASSTAFLLDTEPPSPVVVSSPQATNVWSSNNQPDYSWPASSDGSGTGLSHYGLRLSSTQSALLFEHSSTNLTYQVGPLVDSGDWIFSVTPVDMMGNRGITNTYGPLCIDATPPLASNAVALIVPSAFGTYVMGPEVLCTWAGFDDTASGIDFYYIVFGPRTGFPPLQTYTTAQQLFNCNETGVEYDLMVWACDYAGNISSAAIDSAIVRDGTLDGDSDGYSGTDEETAGTNDDDPASVFRVGLLPGMPPTLCWTGLTERVYSVQSAGALTNDWSTLTNMIGKAGQMTFEPADSQGSEFYRLKVERAP